MEELPLIETVYQAIETLNHDPDCQKKNEANRWLIDLQKSIYAWKIADELIQRQADIESCCFGAQMIRNKIMFSFHELPQEAVLSLHSSLMQQLSKITEETNHVIITQLCVAVVDLSLQMNTWNNPIYSFFKCNEIHNMVLLEILKVFPEEIDTKLIRLGANRRNIIQEELSSCAGLLNEYLKRVTTENPRPEVLLKALKCFSSWVTLIKNISDIVECDLIPKVFQILTDPPVETYKNSSCIESKLHDAATDLLCNVFKTLRSPEANCVLDRNLCEKIAAFENAYHISVACESAEKSINYCRIFSELGEAFLLKMVQETKPGEPHFSIQTLNYILICVGHHDYEVSSVTFGFWFALAELLYNRDDDNVSAEFKPYVDRLLTALRRQVQMEPDSEGLLSDDDEFRMFREKVCDLIKDLIFVVGSTYMFEKILAEMQNSPPATWDQMEANLFVMFAIAWKISPSENNIIPMTVRSIFDLPETAHVAVKHTAILILGELRDWFDEHPDYLTLTYLKFNLCCEELADAAASSLCYICCAAKTKLKNEFAPLLDILKNLHSFSLKNKSDIYLIKSVIAVMCQLSTDDICIAMKKVCSLQVAPLRKYLEDRTLNLEGLTNGNSIEPAVWLDRLAAVFRYVEQPQSSNVAAVPNDVKCACVPAFSEMQPVVFQIMDCFQKDIIVMERCCRCLRFAIRAVGRHGVFLLETLARKLVELYQANGHSCFLYVGSILVDEYGDDSSNWDILLQMVHAFIGPTFDLLQHPDGFREHPDTIDDLFRLCSRTLQRLPIAFLHSAAVGPLLECGLVAISLDHREANSSVMKFFHEMFDCSSSNDLTTEAVKREAVRRIYEDHGESLVRNLLHASVFVLPSYTLVGVGEVLYDLIQFRNKDTLKWIELAVQQLPNLCTNGGPQASPEQIQAFLSVCEQATKTRDVSRALRDFTLYYY